MIRFSGSSERVPFVDLASRHREAAQSVESAVLRVLRSGVWVGGPEVAQAEAVAARWLGRGGAVGVASGTDALILALQALEVRPGDEVVVPALTFFATAGAVLAVGAVPVVVDVDEAGLLDLRRAEAAVGPRTRAIVPVHLFGNRAAAPQVDVPILDDAAQAIGTEPAPAIGVLTALSAYPTKTWGAAGDAGFVASDDPELLDRVRKLGRHGQIGPHLHAPVGGATGRASRLDTLQAAILLGHAEVLGARLRARRDRANQYDEGLPRTIRPLPRQPGSSVHQYVVRVEDRERIAAALGGLGIDTAVYYPRPLDRQPALAGLRHGPTPIATTLCQEVLALPIHDVTAAQVDRVLEALQTVVGANG